MELRSSLPFLSLGQNAFPRITRDPPPPRCRQEPGCPVALLLADGRRVLPVSLECQKITDGMIMEWAGGTVWKGSPVCFAPVFLGKGRKEFCVTEEHHVGTWEAPRGPCLARTVSSGQRGDWRMAASAGVVKRQGMHCQLSCKGICQCGKVRTFWK